MVMSFCIGGGAGYGVYYWPKTGIVTIGVFIGSGVGSLIYILFFSKLTGNQKLALDL